MSFNLSNGGNTLVKVKNYHPENEVEASWRFYCFSSRKYEPDKNDQIKSSSYTGLSLMTSTLNKNIRSSTELYVSTNNSSSSTHKVNINELKDLLSLAEKTMWSWSNCLTTIGHAQNIEYKDKTAQQYLFSWNVEADKTDQLLVTKCKTPLVSIKFNNSIIQ